MCRSTVSAGRPVGLDSRASSGSVLTVSDARGRDLAHRGSSVGSGAAGGCGRRRHSPEWRVRELPRSVRPGNLTAGRRNQQAEALRIRAAARDDGGVAAISTPPQLCGRLAQHEEEHVTATDPGERSRSRSGATGRRRSSRAVGNSAMRQAALLALAALDRDLRSASRMRAHAPACGPACAERRRARAARARSRARAASAAPRPRPRRAAGCAGSPRPAAPARRRSRSPSVVAGNRLARELLAAPWRSQRASSPRMPAREGRRPRRPAAPPQHRELFAEPVVGELRDRHARASPPPSRGRASALPSPGQHDLRAPRPGASNEREDSPGG